MNATLARRARKALATTLAAGALTAGLGLATTATAEATPSTKICISNLSGTAKITNGATKQSFTAPARLHGNGTMCVFKFFSTSVSDHDTYSKADKGVDGFGGVDLTTDDFDTATVSLAGSLSPDPLTKGADAAFVNVPIKATKSGDYVLVENIVDRRGDHSETTLRYHVEFTK